MASPVCSAPCAGLRCSSAGRAVRRYGGAGAVWDIWPRRDVPALAQWLLAHAREFTVHGAPLDAANIMDAIHDQVRVVCDGSVRSAVPPGSWLRGLLLWGLGPDFVPPGCKSATSCCANQGQGTKQ